MSETHLSLFRAGKVRGVRFSTLAKLCAALGCQPGDLLEYEPGDEEEEWEVREDSAGDRLR